MSYTKQNFKDNEILYAAQLDHIEDGIVNMTPVKGVDYFTDEEIAAILEYATKDIFVAKITYDPSTQKYITETSSSSINQAFYEGKTMLCIFPLEYGCILLDTFETHESTYSFSKITPTTRYEVVVGGAAGEEVTPTITKIDNDSTFIVNLSFGENSREGLTDKYYYEIKQAFDKGKIILGKCYEEFIPLYKLDENQDEAYFFYTQFTEDYAVGSRYLFKVGYNGVSIDNFQGLQNTEKRVNPQPLKLTGAVTAEYDGSKEVNVDIPSSDISVVYWDPDSDNNLDKTFEDMADAIQSGKALFLSYFEFQFPLLLSNETQIMFLGDASEANVIVIATKDAPAEIIAIPKRVSLNINGDNTCVIGVPLNTISIAMPLNLIDFYVNSFDNIVLSPPSFGEMGELVIQGFNFTENKKFAMMFYGTQEGVVEYYPFNPLNITNATVGQIAKITAVDAAGKPTEWEPVEMPHEEEWELIQTITITEAVNSVIFEDISDYKKFRWYASVNIDTPSQIFVSANTALSNAWQMGNFAYAVAGFRKGWGELYVDDLGCAHGNYWTLCGTYSENNIHKSPWEPEAEMVGKSRFTSFFGINPTIDKLTFWCQQLQANMTSGTIVMYGVKK